MTGIAEEPTTLSDVELPYRVTLAFEVHGVTVERSVAARAAWEDGALHVEAAGAFLFTDFGIKLQRVLRSGQEHRRISRLRIFQGYAGSEAVALLGATGSLLPVASVAAEEGTGGQAASGTHSIRFASVASQVPTQITL